jgi:hypothetical protein
MHDLIDREFIPQVITPANIDPSKAPQAVSTSL